MIARFIRFSRRAAATLHRSQEGSVMLEFVIFTPVICYLLVATIYIRHHIDYGMDSTLRARLLSWEEIVPSKIFSTTGDASDTDEFFSTPLQSALQFAGSQGIDGSTGGMLAAERYFNLPYERVKLRTTNYVTTYRDGLPVEPEPWGHILGGFSQFFGTSYGGGQYRELRGLRDDLWNDRFPVTGDPWMYNYNPELDISLGPMKPLFIALAGLTAGNIHFPMYDFRFNDVGANPPDWGPGGTNNKLRLQSVTGKNAIKVIIQ